MAGESPLLAIKDAERAAAERIEEVREEVEREVDAALVRAEEMVAEAEERGRRRASAHYRSIVDAAGREAEEIKSKGTVAADRVGELIAPRFDRIVDALVHIVLPQEEA